MNPFLEFIEKNSTFPNINPLSYQEINHNCPRCQKNNPKYECQKCNHFWCSDHSCQHLKIPSKSIIKILDNCPICLTGYSQKTSYQLTPCNHTFHFDYIKKWLFLNDVSVFK